MIGPVLVCGADGMLGSDLVATAPPSIELRVSVDPVTSKRLDITDRRAVCRLLDEAAPGVVINAAAYTRVDLAEEEGDRAHAVNAVAPTQIAQECARRGIFLVHFSTDYVFPGTTRRPYLETDPVDPINEYGRSKLAGEQGILASTARSLIIRTQWLFGARGKSFPRTMWERATKRLATRVVDDQFGRPTYSRDLAEITWRLIDRQASGLVHVANAETASWFDLAAVVFAAVGADSLLTRCATAAYPTTAPRPAFSVLDTTRAERLLGASMPRWQESVLRFLGELESDRGEPDVARAEAP